MCVCVRERERRRGGGGGDEGWFKNNIKKMSRMVKKIVYPTC